EAVGTAFAPLPVFGPLPAEDEMPRPLSPSGASVLIEDAKEPVVSERSPVLDGVEDTGFAAARGSVIHMLLQVLPDMPVEEREGAARRYLARAAGDWPQAEREAALAQVEGILGDPGVAPIFSSGSRPEVAI